MALPPPRAPVAPTPTEEAQRAALDARHSAAVKDLERILDVSLAGKRKPGLAVTLILPEGGHAPQVLADVKAHYLAAGWSKVETDEGEDVAEETHALPGGGTEVREIKTPRPARHLTLTP
jgi:hypothetical protein